MPLTLGNGVAVADLKAGMLLIHTPSDKVFHVDFVNSNGQGCRLSLGGTDRVARYEGDFLEFYRIADFNRE